MDRTGKLILVVSILLLIAGPILQNKFGPKSKLPVSDTNASIKGTNLVSQTNGQPSVVEPAPIEGEVKNTNAVPVSPSTNAVPVTPETGPKTPLTPEDPEQKEFLENEFVKFTFTNRGGGVKKVELKKYLKEVGRNATNAEPVELRMDRGRLPLLAFEPKTGDINDNTPDAPRPYAQQLNYVLSKNGTNIVATSTYGNFEIRKIFSLQADYQLKTTIQLVNRSENPSSENDFFLVAGAGFEPPSSSRMMGLNFGAMWFNGDEEIKVGPSEMLGNTETDASGWFDNKPMGCSCIPGGNPRNNYNSAKIGGQGNVRWLGAYSRFFIQALIPEKPGQSVHVNQFRLNSMSKEELGDAQVKIKNNQKAWEAALRVEVPPLPAGGTNQINYILYAGPKEYDRLREIGTANGGNQFHRIMGFGKWFGWVAEGLLRLMKWMAPSLEFLEAIKISSWALAIICITLAIKLVFWPITAKTTRAMKKMAAVNAKMMPEITKIRERYKNDYQKMNMKMMETYKKYGVNPLSQVGGCLPMLIQIPIFFGFFTMLRSAVELRGAEFLWASDLSSPDTIATLAGFPINIMPLLMTATMFFQMRLQPPSPGMDPTQQAMMKYMPLMFVIFFYSASSGLCLYWTVQNVLTIIQTKLTKVDPEAGDKGNTQVEVIPPNKKRKRT